MKNNIINILNNKNVNYNFIVNYYFDAGIILKGWEIKSIRSKNISLNNSYIFIKNYEIFLKGLNIQSNFYNNIKYNFDKKYKLLLNKKEIKKINSDINIKGYTAVVLSIFLKNHLCKIKIGIVKGKKKYDKREFLKKNKWKIDKLRYLKNINKN
ncbi:SsrA-binding protein [Candidatus Annandia adelgestsuga]|uniref:SsrA-binding protein n=1 Tax=Candidatus Annandia adelgestsuga TaxID=1302411 RepID=A0A3Q9CNZ8_9ENTR|nr:SsrA-binding protein SmpB [Candidatus Annandia adelgestsuga]AZP36156.1 SsrA-binding protein [Candidatus Annandia adelgestsuga]